MADLFKVMQREMLHSEHAAQCYLEAKRRDSAKQQAPKPLPPPPTPPTPALCGPQGPHQQGPRG